MKRINVKLKTVAKYAKGNAPFSGRTNSKFSTASGNKWIIPTEIKSPPENAAVRLSKVLKKYS